MSGLVGTRLLGRTDTEFPPSSLAQSRTLHNNGTVERERELCPAFLIDDFEAAAREAAAAVARVNEIASKAVTDITADDLMAQPEWERAQRALQWQFRARAALEMTGLPLPPEARERADRVQAEFSALALRRTSTK
jgi:hypothetical protein